MPNRTLTKDELVAANKLLDKIRSRLDDLGGGDRELRFAYNRKIAKELGYDERGRPMERRKLKLQKGKDQAGKCALCGRELPDRGAVLDRFRAVDGYTSENTRLICSECDVEEQTKKAYA